MDAQTASEPSPAPAEKTDAEANETAHTMTEKAPVEDAPETVKAPADSTPTVQQQPVTKAETAPEVSATDTKKPRVLVRNGKPAATTDAPVVAHDGQEECECNLTLGTPRVDGQAAGASGRAKVAAGKPATMTITVTNTGNGVISGLRARGAAGSLTCGQTTLAPGQSTTCTGTYTPKAGDQSSTITVDAVTVSGEPLNARVTYYVTGQVADTTDSGSGSDTPVSNQPGTNQPGTGADEPAPGTGSTQPGSSTDEECECNLTLGTPRVGGQAAGSAGKAKVEAGTPVPVTINVTNTGKTVITDLRARGAAGSLTCARGTLAPGQSTTCTGMFTPRVGDQSTTVTVDAVTVGGEPLSGRVTYYVTGTAGSGTNDDPADDEPGSDQPGDGSTTPTDGSGLSTSPLDVVIEPVTETLGSLGGLTGGVGTVPGLPGSPDGSTDEPTDPQGGTDGTDGSGLPSAPQVTPGADGSFTIVLNGTTYKVTSDGTVTPVNGTNGAELPQVTKGADGSYTIVYNGVTYKVQPNGSVTTPTAPTQPGAPQVTPSADGSFTIVLNGTTYKVTSDGTVTPVNGTN
ncbi:hypothetical protein G5C66_20345, partial [Nocardioides sp. KC13]